MNFILNYCHLIIFAFVFTGCCHDTPVVDSMKSKELITLSQQLLDLIKTGKEAKSAVSAIAEISGQDLLSLDSDEKKMAFWINLYNGMIQYTLAEEPERYEDKNTFFKTAFIQIAGRKLSLDEIEHGLLRRSRNKISLGYLPKFFISRFERQNRVKNLDPRIHFALNCGARSCPPIVIFDEKTLDTRLDESTRNYLKNEVKIEGNIVYTTSLMSWFRADFGGKKGIRKFLTEYEIIEKGTHPELKFRDYDWTLDTGQFINDDDFEIKPFTIE